VPGSDIETIVLPEVALHLDARWFPVLVATWFGRTTVGAVERYAAWLDRMGVRAEAEGTRLVILGDTTRLEDRPGPDVRTAMAATIEGLQARHPGRFLGGSTIVAQPVMRAVLLMVLALTRRALDIKPVKDFEQALERTFALLDEAGIPRPAGLDAASYQGPARPRE
jgi:hypothetical protein